MGTTCSVSSNIGSTEKHTPYAGAAGMLLHINGKFTMGKLKSSLVVKFRFNHSLKMEIPVVLCFFLKYVKWTVFISGKVVEDFLKMSKIIL